MEVTSCFEDIQGKLLEEISCAEISIHIAVAWFTDKELLKALINKAIDGVNIQILVSGKPLDNGQELDFDYFKNHEKFNYFELHSSIPILMHNKFCVIDLCTVITGSYNWTTGAQTNMENIIILRNCEKLAHSYIEEFEKIVHDYFTIPLQAIRFEAEKKMAHILGSLTSLLDKLIKTKDYSILEEYDAPEYKAIDTALFLPNNRKNELSNLIPEQFQNREKWWKELPNEWKLFYNKKYRGKVITDYIGDQALGSLLNDTKLELGKNAEISSLKGIVGLTKLLEFSCFGNQISCIEGIETLTNLEKFNCSRNKIKSLKQLELLPYLKFVNASENNLVDIDFSSESLESLNCSRNNINTFPSKSHFPLLKTLSLNRNKISSLNSIPTFKKLTSLHLDDNLINDLRNGFKNVQNVLELSLEGNGINFLHGIEYLKNLEELCIFKNNIFSLESLDKLKKLKLLKMHDKKKYNMHWIGEESLVYIRTNGGFGKEKTIEYESPTKEGGGLEKKIIYLH